MASPDPTWKLHFTKATPAQTRALASIAALVADPARWLPTSVWADRQIRAFVPARYLVAFDRGYPDLSKLPPPAAQSARPVQASQATRVPDPDDGSSRGTPSGVRRGWNIPLGEPCVGIRLRFRRPASPSPLVPPPGPCPSRRSLLTRTRGAIRGTETRTPSAVSRRPSGLHRRKERFRD